MSLFRRSLPLPAVLSDEAIGRWLAAVRTEIEPDPLFRRRLRGHVMNRYVAAREGLAPRRRPSGEMGRLGRAVLYASFVLGLSVSGAMAAAQQAIPGDPFYGMKLQIEAMRLHVAPDHLQDDLAAYTLGERLDELQRLSDAGNWAAVEAHVPAVEAAYDAVLAVTPDPAVRASHLELAERLLERLPAQAQAAVERALADPSGTAPTTRGGRDDAGAGAGHEGPPPEPARGSGGPGADVDQGVGVRDDRPPADPPPGQPAKMLKPAKSPEPAKP